MNDLLTMRCGSLAGASGGLRSNMKTISSLAVVIALAALGLGSPRAQAADEEGLAVAIVFDTSGSMQEQVRDRDGKSAPKYVIANRALIAIAKQIQTFATNSASGTRRRVHTALFIFDAQNGKEVIKMGPFDAAAIQDWARSFSSPSGNTPLGNALNAASQ